MNSPLGQGESSDMGSRNLVHAVWFIRDTSIKDIVKSPDKLRDTLMRRLLVHTKLRDTALQKVSVSV